MTTFGDRIIPDRNFGGHGTMVPTAVQHSAYCFSSH